MGARQRKTRPSRCRLNVISGPFSRFEVLCSSAGSGCPCRLAGQAEMDSGDDGKTFSGRPFVVLSSRGRRAERVQERARKWWARAQNPPLQASCECRDDGFDVRDAEDLGPPGSTGDPEIWARLDQRCRHDSQCGSLGGVANKPCTDNYTNVHIAASTLAVFLPCPRPSASTASLRQTPKARRGTTFTEPAVTGCTRASRPPCRRSATPRSRSCQGPASH